MNGAERGMDSRETLKGLSFPIKLDQCQAAVFLNQD